jgi:hypothetical protein
MKNSGIFYFRAGRRYLLYLVLLLIVAGATPIKSPLKIIRVGLNKKSFNPSKGETVELYFEVTTQADVRVDIYDALGRRIRSFDMPGITAGKHSIKWNGLNTNGQPVAGNVFLYVIEASTKNGKKIVYNPVRKTGGFEAELLEYTLDRKTGKIEYVLPKACMVRIRAGLKDSMFAKSLMNWLPHTAGRHSFKWDGKDCSGKLNLFKHKDLQLRLTCYTLPENSIITTGEPASFGPDKNTHQLRKKRAGVWATEGKYLHYGHLPGICRPPGFNVLFPSSSNTAGSNISVVSGIVPIRIELDRQDVNHLINTRFEVMIFIDGVFIYEIEDGSSPFTFNWDTASFSKGPHILTVNIIGYDDHIGIVSRQVIIGD